MDKDLQILLSSVPRGSFVLSSDLARHDNKDGGLTFSSVKSRGSVYGMEKPRRGFITVVVMSSNMWSLSF